MKPVTLNLATRPFRNNALIGSLLALVSLSLVGATGYNLYVYLGYGSAFAQLQRDQISDRQRLVELENEERRLVGEIQKRDFKSAYDRGRLAGDLIRKSAFSWTLLFNTLEGVVPPDVVTTAIRPNITSESIVLRIEGVAKSDGALLSFEDRLLHNPAFSKVYPLNERKLNPSLPDITFLLACDYLPERIGAVAPQTVAEAKGGAGAAGAASAPAPAPGDGAVDGGAGGGAGPQPASTVATAAAAPGSAHGRAAGVVGRDLQPVAERVSRETRIAPGGVLLAEGGAPPASRRPKDSGRGAKRDSARPATGVPSKAPLSAAPNRGGAPGGAPAGSSVRTRAAGGSPSGAASRVAAPPAPSSAPSPAPIQVSRTVSAARPWDPNVPRTLPPEQQALRSADPKPKPKPAPARRLDVPLSFVQRPVGDVYRNLGEAHGVRFEIDPGLDARVPVTLNLEGRSLEDAVAIVAGMVHHRVTKVAEGVYRVVTVVEGQAPLQAPVTEETIQDPPP